MTEATTTKPRTLTGQEAIEYARDNGCLLCKYDDPIEDARDDLTPSEADDVAWVDPNLIYLDVTTLVGREAIDYARTHGCTLRIEDARDDLTPDQAEDVAREDDPDLIYLIVGAGGL